MKVSVKMAPKQFRKTILLRRTDKNGSGRLFKCQNIAQPRFFSMFSLFVQQQSSKRNFLFSKTLTDIIGWRWCEQNIVCATFNKSKLIVFQRVNFK